MIWANGFCRNSSQHKQYFLMAAFGYHERKFAVAVSVPRLGNVSITQV